MKEKYYLYSFLYLILSIMLILVVGFRPLEYFRDTAVYLSIIHSGEYALSIEPSIWIISSFNSFYLGGKDQGFFLIYAILGVSIKAYAIKKISLLPLLSFYLYICLYLFLHEMTQIRVGVASAIFLLSVPDLVSRNYKKYFSKTIFAVFFHYSAIIMFFLYFIKTDKVNKKLYFCLPFIGVLISFFPDLIFDLLSSSYFLLPDQIGRKVEVYLGLTEDEDYNKINLFNLFILSLICFYYFMFFNLDKIRKNIDILLFKLLGIQIFIFYFFSVIPTIAFRLSEFVGICLVITIPQIIFIFREKIFPFLFFIFWAGVYFLFVSVNLLII